MGGWGGGQGAGLLRLKAWHGLHTASALVAAAGAQATYVACCTAGAVDVLGCNPRLLSRLDLETLSITAPGVGRGGEAELS